MPRTNEPSGAISRRQVFRFAGAAAVAVPAAGLLSGCAVGGTSDDGARTTAKGGAEKTPQNPFGVVNGGTVDIVVFKGGFGDAYATDVHEKLLAEKFPELRVKHSGVPKVAEVLQPRFVGGNPPDVTSLGDLDLGALIQAGQLADLTALFDAPSVDDASKKVRDTLAQGTVAAGTTDGRIYQLYYTQGISGIWYNKQLFEKKGWTPPKTWAEFTALAAKIKASGTDVFGVGGKNAPDYGTAVIMVSAAKLGGEDVLRDIDNLHEGAWNHPAVLKAFTAWADFAGKYVHKRYAGLMHTEAQLRQVQDQLAFYPAGDFIENEMKKDTPAGFTYAFIPVPSLTAADAMPVQTVRAQPGEAFVVPAKGANTAAGMEYLRQMLSKAGTAGFTELTGGLTSVTSAAEGVRLPPGRQSSSAAFAAAGTHLLNYRFMAWYPPMADEIKAVTSGLLFGSVEPADAVERMQKKADAVRSDSSIKKFQR
ncbi:N-acetylglucosamine/diacetylchitobiose ABC transporter substrate-binding protein [Streptomyces sp. FIT100]|uniref:N-acetylglucosamine/diacetylchitobiose ABC transporter substrate-binding protein n=1 Tax=Streptomyces sp. FIT100 TaxID=2837956 RepID=UPI0021C58838|nr:N-acetylglucosamine/diacetylchitobiose ABC transporter substrate-binding protein [Streptomyces sp. FIT100]UUN25665.1 N-acetylglucosamine/diacetylchitobiose ABC transporter substrate-binding protein [Streptomyces sp. FIT100]